MPDRLAVAPPDRFLHDPALGPLLLMGGLTLLLSLLLDLGRGLIHTLMALVWIASAVRDWRQRHRGRGRRRTRNRG